MKHSEWHAFVILHIKVAIASCNSPSTEPDLST